MTMVGESHVVPSGRVYRQIFDAEVQLVRSLKEARARSAHHEFPLESVRIPLVRDVEARTGVLLSPRQQLWIESMPNDGFTENPVFYREYMTAVIKRTQESESEIAAREVRGLPDVIVPETTESNFLQRITEERKERHEAAQNALQRKLVFISKELEALVLSTGKSFQTKLIESNKNVEQQFQKIENETDKTSFTLQDFKDVWIAVANNSQCRRQWIKEMDENLTSLEGNRAKQIGDVLKEYTKILEKISYFTPHDVYRLIHREAMLINQAVLANQRAVAKLSVNLVESDMKQETSHWLRWQDIVKSWKTTQRDSVIQMFRVYIENKEVQDPESVKKEFDFMVKEQNELNEKRLKHLQSVRELLPPTCTKSKVAEWYTTLTDLNKEIDSVGGQYLNNIRAQYEAVCQQCVSEIQKSRTKLVDMKICCLEEAQKVVFSNLFPLVGQLQKKFEERLELIDKALVKLAKQTEDNYKDLFKYSEVAAHSWDVLEAGLLHQEKKLQRKLDDCRQHYDLENQTKEANLDVTLDKLRQESSQQDLDNSMQRVLHALEDIRNGYKVLHKKQVEIVAKYPVSVLREITSYSSSVSQYFGVKEIYGQEQSEEEEDEDEDEESVEDTVPVEVFTTSKGNTYSVVLSKEIAQPVTEELFLTEVTVEEELPEYLQQLAIPENTFHELKKDIRLGFFEHLETWFDQAVSDSQSIVASKTDELTAELELFYHLQEPRAQRIEKDVHHVRAAELVLHQERVESHCAGMKEALKNLKNEFTLLKDNLKNETKNYQQTISNMEPTFMNITKSDKLAAHISSLYSRRDRYMEDIRIILRNYRQHFDNILGLLRDTNADFVKSFRLFSDGGNFSPEEFGVLRNKLTKAAKEIDTIERGIMGDLEGMESKCLEQGTDIIRKFEEKFQTLITDMIFMENIQRQLAHLQVKIKAEVAFSNVQAQKLHDSLEHFSKKIDACARPNIEKEAINAEELYNFAKSVMENMVNRSKYLNCLLEPSYVEGRTPLQDPFAAAAARSETFQQENKLLFSSSASLLQPSEMGKPVLEDVAVRLIRTILESQQLSEKEESALGGPDLQQLVPPQPTGQATDVTRNSTATGAKKSTPVQGLKSDTSLTKLPSIRHFKGEISTIISECNTILLALAEEFYSRRDKHVVVKLGNLYETYEQCTIALMQKLQTYQNQTDEYHSACLLELREQLEQSENLLALIPPLLIADLQKQHLDRLHSSRDAIQLHFMEKLQNWEHARAENEKMLRPSLGHPANLKQLQELCKQEESRQQLQAKEIALKTQTLQMLFAEYAEDFVSELSSVTEKLLLEFDENLCVDDIEKQTTEMSKEKMSTLLCRKQAGLPLEDMNHKRVIQRGYRTWPGLYKIGLTEADKKDKTPEETATVTTAKTTLGHISAVEARDAAYETYEHSLAMEIASIEEEENSQIMKAEHWNNWWEKSVLQIKKLYA